MGLRGYGGDIKDERQIGLLFGLISRPDHLQTIIGMRNGLFYKEQLAREWCDSVRLSAMGGCGTAQGHLTQEAELSKESKTLIGKEDAWPHSGSSHAA